MRMDWFSSHFSGGAGFTEVDGPERESLEEDCPGKDGNEKNEMILWKEDAEKYCPRTHGHEKYGPGALESTVMENMVLEQMVNNTAPERPGHQAHECWLWKRWS